MKIFLTVVFIVGGEPTVFHGMLPREQPDMETCIRRRDFLEGELPNYDKLPRVAAVGCVKAETPFQAAEKLALRGVPA